MITEAEARDKVCPFMNTQGTTYSCVAGKCMAWVYKQRIDDTVLFLLNKHKTIDDFYENEDLEGYTKWVLTYEDNKEWITFQKMNRETGYCSRL